VHADLHRTVGTPQQDGGNERWDCEQRCDHDLLIGGSGAELQRNRSRACTIAARRSAQCRVR
jgi:hypothetical protein